MQTPYTIRTIIDQLGGLGLRGAFAYVGVRKHSITYTCPPSETEHRASYRSRATPEGLLDYEVGLTFPVNGGRRQNWTMLVAYEPNDTYTAWRWRSAKASEKARGIAVVVLDQREDVYCDELQSTVESMYDEAIRKHSQGFIPL